MTDTKPDPDVDRRVKEDMRLGDGAARSLAIWRADREILNPVIRTLRPLMRDPDRLEPRMGGSIAAALCGAAPWASPFDAFVELTEGYRRPVTKKMAAGKRFEHAIYGWAEEEFQWTRSEWIGDKPLTHPIREWQRFSPDVVFLDLEQIADIKRATYAAAFHGPPGSDEIGDYEMIQIQCYMEALISIGLPIKQARLAIHDLHRDDIIEYIVPYEPALGELIVETCERFWYDHVLPKKPPAIGGGESVRRYLEAKHPRETMPLREATPAEIAWCQSIHDHQAAIGRHKTAIDLLKNELRASIGDARGINYDLGSATWSEVSKDAVVLPPTTYRVLRVTARKPKQPKKDPHQ